MKKFGKFLLCLEVCLFIFGKYVSAASNPYPKMQTIDAVTTVSCTYFAWQQVYEKLGIELPRWGNAVNWYERAKKANFQVGSEARANSIAVWQNSNSIYGHVAYVLRVNGNNMVINEGGITILKHNSGTNDIEKIPYNGDGIYYNNIVPSIGSRSKTSSLIGFIYLTNEEITDTNNQSEENILEDVETNEDNNKDNNKDNNRDSNITYFTVNEQEKKRDESKDQIFNKKEKNIVQKKKAKQEEKERIKSNLKSTQMKVAELKNSKVSKEIIEEQSKNLSMLRNLNTTIFSLFLLLFKLIDIF